MLKGNQLWTRTEFSTKVSEDNIMKWFDTVVSTTREILEASGRARALSTLRQMDAEFLRRYGYAPEKIARGIDAWPWRIDAAADVAVVTFSAASTSAEQPTAAAQPAELEHAA
ncbi:MAG: hypothetical protein ACI8W7_002392 [Gammaproteobacteria bacterium]